MRIAIALVLALGVRAAYALPTQMIAALRAITCCAKHCGHMPDRPVTPSRCCAVSQDASDQARTVAPHTESGADAAVALAAPTDLPQVRALGVALGALPAGHERAGPIFLLTRSLRC